MFYETGSLLSLSLSCFSGDTSCAPRSPSSSSSFCISYSSLLWCVSPAHVHFIAEGAGSRKMGFSRTMLLPPGCFLIPAGKMDEVDGVGPRFHNNSFYSRFWFDCIYIYYIYHWLHSDVLLIFYLIFGIEYIICISAYNIEIYIYTVLESHSLAAPLHSWCLLFQSFWSPWCC